MANVFDQFEGGDNVFDQFENKKAIEKPKEASVGDYGMSAVAGANELLPALAGLPVDTVQNIINLGISAYGTAKNKLTGSTDLPEIMPPAVGSSEWIRDKIKGGLGVDPFTVPDPTDPIQQNIKMGSSILASGALSPATGAKQLLGNVGRMVVPATGAIAAKETFPNEPLAPMIGMLAAPGIKPALQYVKQKIAPTINAGDAFIKAHKMGYKVPPAMAKPTKKNQFMEGAAGPVPTKQKASIYNQNVTNRIVKDDIGYPKDTPLSIEGLEAVRKSAGKVYEKIKKLGAFKTDKKFIDDLDAISMKNTAISNEFPELLASPHGKQDAAGLAKLFRKDKISSEAIVDAVKQLRADAKVGFKSQDPGTYSLAKANSRMANALESLMERSIEKSNIGKSLIEQFKLARKRIAKTYTIERVLKGENIDAVALGRLLDKGNMLSGKMRDVAEFGQNFKGAAQTNVPQQTNFRPMDLLTGVGAATATGDVTWLALMAARPATRTLLLSKPYQSILSKIKPVEMQKIKQLPNESQAAAIGIMLDELQNSGNKDSK